MVQIVKTHASLSHLAFDKLAKSYGSIMRLKIGLQDVGEGEFCIKFLVEFGDYVV